MREIRSIIECLMQGQDVLVLSASKKISGFLPVVLRCLVEPQGHIVKIMYSTEGALTADQRGYIAGLVDAQYLVGSSILRDIDKIVGGENYYDDEKFSLEPENVSLLEQQLLYVRSYLDEIGRELFHEITLELKALTDFLTECEEHPNVDITLGSFASIGYRLCDVYKETSTLGYDAIKTFRELEQSVLSKSQYPEQLAMIQTQLMKIADQLEHICNNKMCFLTCDLEVLRGHPEVAEASELSNSLKLINEQLSEIQGYMEQVTTEARQFSEMQDSAFKPALPKENKDWHAARVILEQCVQQAIEVAQAKIRNGGATGLPPKSG
jgi:hypothetical protein